MIVRFAPGGKAEKELSQTFVPPARVVRLTPGGKGSVYTETVVEQLLGASVECRRGTWRGSTGPGYFSAPIEVMRRGFLNASGRVGAAMLIGDANQLFDAPDVVRNMNETRFLIELEDEGGAGRPSRSSGTTSSPGASGAAIRAGRSL